MRFAVAVDVMPKEGISDPQGTTIERALPGLGYRGVSGVRVGKRIEFLVEATTEEEARALVEGACRRLLANPVIEDFRFTVSAAAPAGAA